MDDTEEYFKKIREPMQFLHSMLNINKEEIEEYCSDEGKNFIRILMPELLDDEPIPEIITPPFFVK